MTIYELRDLLEQFDLADLPLRCSTYSRVSTEKETQAASLHNMTDDFRDFIERHEKWTRRVNTIYWSQAKFHVLAGIQWRAYKTSSTYGSVVFLLFSFMMT